MRTNDQGDISRGAPSAQPDCPDPRVSRNEPTRSLLPLQVIGTDIYAADSQIAPFTDLKGVHHPDFRSGLVALVYAFEGVSPELIVRAVNSHADLLAALKEVMAVLQAEAPGTPLNNHKYDGIGIRAHAAIRKAEAPHDQRPQARADVAPALLAALKAVEQTHGTYSNGNYVGCHCDACIQARVVIAVAEAH
jgi:hypothetical protein